MHRRADLKFILAIALLLRFAFLLLAGVNAPLAGDELAYQQIAANVAAGRGFVQDNNPFFPGQILYAWQAPLYPLSLAGLYFFFGPHPLIAKLLGILIGVGTVYLTFDLARRVFSDSPIPWGPLQSLSSNKGGEIRVARLAAVLVAVYPGFLTSAHLLLSETLFTFLLVLAFDLIAAAVDSNPAIFSNKKTGQGNVVFPVEVRTATPSKTGGSPSLTERGRAGLVFIVAAGAMWGAATLTRGIALYFVLPLTLWLAVRWAPNARVEWREFVSGRKRLPFDFSPRMAVVFAVAMVAVMMPWTIRNFTVFGQFVISETKGGVNFWLGNSPFTPNDFIRNVWKTGVREPMLAALPEDETARDSAGYSLGESFVISEPLTFITRMPVKFADFWGFERNLVDAAEATRNGKAGGWSSPGKIAADLVSDAAYVLMVLFAVAGLVFAKEDRWKVLIGGFILYFVLVHTVVFGDGRFHLPLIPFLALYAAWLIVNLDRNLHWRSMRGLTALALVLVFAAVWAHEIMAAWMELRGGL